MICVVQFEKASQIYQIDIGNDGSAFIEVLVGRSAMRDDEYQVLTIIWQLLCLSNAILNILIHIAKINKLFSFSPPVKQNRLFVFDGFSWRYSIKGS